MENRSMSEAKLESNVSYFKWEIPAEAMKIIAKYFKSSKDYINVMKVCKKYKPLIPKFNCNEEKNSVQEREGKDAIEEREISIRDQWFNECTSLTSVQLPSTLVSIGKEALEESNVQSIEIPEGVTHGLQKSFFYVQNSGKKMKNFPLFFRSQKYIY